MEHPLFTLRPNMAVAIVPVVFSSLFTGIVLGIAIGFGSKSVFVGLITGLVAAAAVFLLTLMNLRARRYIFYKTKAEFYEGFLTIVQRTVNYNKVTDCILKKTVWDRMFGTGTIQLITAGHAAVQSQIGSVGLGGGIVIQYIEHPDEIFGKVQELLKGK